MWGIRTAWAGKRTASTTKMTIARYTGTTPTPQPADVVQLISGSANAYLSVRVQEESRFERVKVFDRRAE